MKKLLLLLFVALYSLTSFALFDDGVKVKRLQNLQQLSAVAKQNKRAIVLEFSAEYCAFCIKLEDEVLKPMIRSNDYDDKILLRSVHIDLSDKVIDWNGSTTTSSALAQKYKVFVTPTVIIIDEKGNEIAERQVGINMVDFYSQYLDIEIDKAVAIMNKKQL